jgi:hypothetical protein
VQVEDLSEQRRTRAELHHQAQQLAAVLDNTDALVFVKDTPSSTGRSTRPSPGSAAARRSSASA